MARITAVDFAIVTTKGCRAAQRRSPRGGFTLVELLVAMTVSLIMIYGMVLAFEKIGSEVGDGRAAMDMANKVRSVVHRLRLDLAGVTLPVRPWTSPEPPQGYFEYIDGVEVDDPTTPGRLATIGDLDDMLMFTSRSANEPFTGQIVTPASVLVATSELAEVIWFPRWVDANLDNLVEAKEVTLHRRALLIRPDLGQQNWWLAPETGAALNWYLTPLKMRARDVFKFDNSSGAFVPYAIGSEMALLRNHIEAFNASCDVSVHWHLALVNGGSDLFCLPVPNSLSDLGARENRYCHFPILYTDPASGNVVCLPQRIATATAWPTTLPLPAYPFEAVTDIVNGGAAAFTTPSVPRFMASGVKLGQDLMLNNLLAFDVRAFDVTAPLSRDTAAVPTMTRALEPGEPGFLVGGAVGQGAYVDLGYRVRPLFLARWPLTTANFLESEFSGIPLIGNLPAGVGPVFPPLYPAAIFPAPFANRPRGFTRFTYDTMTLKYESDLATPSILGMPLPATVAMANQDGDTVTDEWSNGWDDDANLAVDDDGEREAPAPYGDPLRGLQVTIRFYETSSRQIQQTPVITNFVPD